jgi:NAD(P)-dependent dehydrogenase (short-subunit alcohol dehydrogenase family)
MRMDEKSVSSRAQIRGVGFATARQLGESGAAIIVVCRDSSRGL